MAATDATGHSGEHKAKPPSSMTQIPSSSKSIEQDALSVVLVTAGYDTQSGFGRLGLACAHRPFSILIHR